MRENVTVVILAGGQGARFWPISRMQRPKQFLSISANGESLIQATARRIVGLVGQENVLIVTNKLHEALIREHVPYATGDGGSPGGSCRTGGGESFEDP